MASKSGCGVVVAALIALVALVAIGSNEGIGYYFEECAPEDEDFFDCMLSIMEEEEEEPKEEGTVTATGVYTYKDFEVTVTANIPLKGGNVTGSMSGSCDGSVKGNYNGQDGGVITGTLSGTCSPFVIKIPAGADYNGTVNKGSKTVPISFDGKGGGITHHGSLTLTYPEPKVTP